MDATKLGASSPLVPLITVGDILTTALPTGSRVAGGADGLSREAAWAVAMRTRPPVFPSLKGGEVALLTVEALRAIEPPVVLDEIVARLAERGGAAVVLVGEATATAIATAETHGLPLIEVPGGTTPAELESTINRAITDRRTELYQRGIVLQQQLFEIAAAGRGLAAIVRALADFAGRCAAVLDEALELRVLRAPARREQEEPVALATLPALVEELRARLATAAGGAGLRGAVELHPSESDWGALVAPIPVGHRLRGYLLLCATDGWSETDRLAISQGASACAIDLGREWAVVEAEARVRGEFLGDLLIAGQASDEQIQARARHLEFDVGQPLCAVAFAVDLDPSSGPTRRRPIGEADLVEATESIVGRWTARAPIGAIAGAVAVLWPFEPSGQDEALARRVDLARRELAIRLDASCSAGIGRRYAGVAGIQRSWQEARQALVIAQSLLGGDRSAGFGQLGAYRVLFQLMGNAEAADYRAEVLGELERYDARHHSELVRTLEAFVHCHGSLIQAAELLAVHRNTLAYRLRRIEELTGRDLASYEDLFELQLALKLRRTT